MDNIILFDQYLLTFRTRIPKCVDRR